VQCVVYINKKNEEGIAFLKEYLIYCLNSNLSINILNYLIKVNKNKFYCKFDSNKHHKQINALSDFINKLKEFDKIPYILIDDYQIILSHVIENIAGNHENHNEYLKQFKEGITKHKGYITTNCILTDSYISFYTIGLIKSEDVFTNISLLDYLGNSK
jgi:hypothetical protein